jgi:AcrR family transcriptional regulator
MTGLRELKKNRTRQAIADAAAGLFQARGFDEVTVDEIAEAAEVSKKTVFNYFPTKEDLVFDRVDDRAARLVAAVRACGPQLDVVESFRTLCHEQIRLIDSLRQRVGRDSGGFFDLIHSNPALQRRMHEVNARLTHLLADSLAELTGSPADDPVVVTVASTLLGAQSALFRGLRARVAGGLSDAAIAAAHRRDTDRVFDLLAVGFTGIPPAIPAAHP